MKKQISCLLLVLVMLFSFSGCGGKGKEVRLEALEKNEALIDKAPPCSALEEVRAALPFEEEPFGSYEENGLESVTYLLRKSPLDIAGVEIQDSFFEFINGKLTNINIRLNDAAGYDAVNAEMARLYGEPVTEELNNGVTMNSWEFQAEYPVKAALMGYPGEEEGKSASGSFQVSYIWFGAEE